MPPPLSQSALRAPLNKILGTEANVRILRILSLAGTPVTAGELAQRAGLGRTGVYPVLAGLEATGIIEFAGAGSHRQIQFRDAHPLANAITSLFRSEAARVDALVDLLRSVFTSLSSDRVLSAWLDGTALTERATRAQHSNADFLTCYLIAEGTALAAIMEKVQSRLPKVEKRIAVNIDIVGMTRSEMGLRLRPESLRSPVLLAGVPPVALLENAETKTARELRNRVVHGYHDDSARRLAIAIAVKLKQDPAGRQLARAHVQRRMRVASKHEQQELREWLRLLSLPSSMLHRFLIDPGPRATRLRQTLPAVGLLTSREREAVIKAQSDEEVKAIMAPRKRRNA